MFQHSYSCSPSPKYSDTESLSVISLSPISLTQSSSPEVHENDEPTEDLEDVQVESSVDLERESQVCVCFVDLLLNLLTAGTGKCLNTIASHYPIRLIDRTA
jgi:hypothetical protein